MSEVSSSHFEYSKSAPIEFADAEIHIWHADLNVAKTRLPQLKSQLSTDEKTRAAKFRFARDAENFIAARAILRQILARYLNNCISSTRNAIIDAPQIEISVNKFGKPFLTKNPQNLKFNIAHSGDKAILAFAKNCEIGVDLEKTRDEIDIENLADFFMTSAEKRAILALENAAQNNAFLQLWTRKEAFLKATGRGFLLDPTQFEIGFAAQVARIETKFDDENARWTIRDLPDFADCKAAVCKAAVCAQGDDLTPRFFDF